MATPYQIPVLQKAIRVLHAIADGSCEPTTNSLARALSIAPATSYRIIRTYAQARWLNIRDDGRCELALGLLPITQAVRQHDLLRREVEDTLRELTEATGMASKVSALDGDEAVTLLRVNSNAPMSLAVQSGARFHLAFGSSGAVFLGAMTDAEVEQILGSAPASCWQNQTPEQVLERVKKTRQHGIAEDLGGFRPDVFGLSAALLDKDGQVEGTLTLTGLLHGLTEKKIQSYRRLLLNKAEELNRPHNANPKIN